VFFPPALFRLSSAFQFDAAGCFGTRSGAGNDFQTALVPATAQSGHHKENGATPTKNIAPAKTVNYNQ